MIPKATWNVALLILAVLAVLVGLWALTPMVVRAQCGSIESTCYTCHQTTDPVYGTTDWHTAFGHRYACWNCHGGNDRAQDKERAHEGLVVNPLNDVYTSCYACHPNDYQQRAEQLAQMLGTTVSFNEPVTRPSVPLPLSAMPVTALTPNSTPVATISPVDWPPAIWLFPLAALFCFSLGWFVWHKRRNR